MRELTRRIGSQINAVEPNSRSSRPWSWWLSQSIRRPKACPLMRMGGVATERGTRDPNGVPPAAAWSYFRLNMDCPLILSGDGGPVHQGPHRAGKECFSSASSPGPVISPTWP